jgi:hypothetical protein
MATPVTCPSCGQTLQVTSDDPDRRLTCPRCLAPLVNPNALVTTAAASPRSEVTAAPPRRARDASPALPDDDVRRDTKGLGVGLILIMLGLLGGISFIASSSSRWGPILIGALLFIGAIIGIVSVVRGKNVVHAIALYVVVLTVMAFAGMVFLFVACAAVFFKMSGPGH